MNSKVNEKIDWLENYMYHRCKDIDMLNRDIISLREKITISEANITTNEKEIEIIEVFMPVVKYLNMYNERVRNNIFLKEVLKEYIEKAIDNLYSLNYLDTHHSNAFDYVSKALIYLVIDLGIDTEAENVDVIDRKILNNYLINILTKINKGEL